MKIIPSTFKMFRFNSVFIRIILCFAALILISISIVGYVSYVNSSNLLIDEVKNTNMTLLKQARDIIDKQVGELDSLTSQVSLDRRVSRAFYVSGADLNQQYSEFVHLFNDIRNYLLNIKSSTKIISNIWIHFNKSYLVVSHESKYDANYFFREVCIYEEGSSLNKAIFEYSHFKALNRYNISYNSEKAKYITFIRSMPMTEEKPYASLVVNVNEQAFKGLISNVNGKSPAFVYVVDPRGNILISSDGLNKLNVNQETVASILNEKLEGAGDGEGFFNKSIKNKNYWVAVTTSSVNGWKYISIIPTEFITEKANIIKSTTFIIIAISLLIGLILSYIVANRIYKPINSIINYINLKKDLRMDRERGGSKDELSFINKFIGYIYNEYKDVESALNKNLPILREKFLNDLINGRKMLNHWEELTHPLDMHIPINSCYCVMVFEVEDYSSYLQHSTKGTSLEQEISIVIEEEKYPQIKIYPVKKTEDIVVCLVNLGLDPHEPEIILDFAKAVSVYFQKNYELMVTTGVGRVYNSVENVSFSYIEALRALEYKVVKGSYSVIQIDEVYELPESNFDYPIEKEQQIINLAKSGDYPALKVLLEDIFACNLKKTGIPPELVNNLFSALAGTAVRTIYEIHSTLEDIFGSGFNIYKRLSEHHSKEDKQKFIKEVFESITNYISARRKNQNQKVYDRIVAYIHDNYSSDISLNSVGEAIGLSIQYISWIFKETSGINFIDYLNNYRVQKAKELLTAPGLSVNEIGQRVGFNNTNNFIRVFKKYEGVTPGQYKETYVK